MQFIMLQMILGCPLHQVVTVSWVVKHQGTVMPKGLETKHNYINNCFAIYIYIYYINTSEIPIELSRENFISSHVKITCYQADLVFNSISHSLTFAAPTREISR